MTKNWKKIASEKKFDYDINLGLLVGKIIPN
jgi:hypothetical protein